MRKPRPCPCCGNENLYVGHESSDEMAVVCWRYGGGCGLRMVVPYPDELRKARSMLVLDGELKKKAIRLWNRRKA